MLRPALLCLLLAACGPSVVPGLDAGALDAGFDAGFSDAGFIDAGQLDAGVLDAGLPDAGAAPTVVRVHYPAGTKSIAIRGSSTPLNWNSGQTMSSGTEDTWTFSSTSVSGTLEFKPLLDDSTWSHGPNYVVTSGHSVDVYPHFNLTQGQFSKRWPAFSSALLGNTRPVWVYLPPTYLENVRARFPVVYMHDGQNLFDPNLAFGGNPWWVQNTVDAAAESGAFAEVIVVGPEATADRIGEYTPTADATYSGSGKGLLYLRMLVEELKPKVDAELRTMPEREHTTLIGSSLGGLISAYAGVVKPEVFGMVGAMSPSTWWDNKVLLAEVASTGTPRPLRVYVDSGDSGNSNDDVTNTAQLAQKYRDLGYTDGATLKYWVQPGAVHSEVWWAQRLPVALTFLVGPRQ